MQRQATSSDIRHYSPTDRQTDRQAALSFGSALVVTNRTATTTTVDRRRSNARCVTEGSGVGKGREGREARQPAGALAR